MSTRISSPPRRLVDDELGALLAPLIPARRPGRGLGGRPRVDDRQAVEGIGFVLTTGVGWTKLPPQLGFGSGWTAWRWLRDWQAAGVGDRLPRAVLDKLGRRQILDWSRAALDSVSVRAKKGGQLTGPNPTDRGKLGSTYHLLVDATGLLIAAVVSAANRHDSLFVAPVLNRIVGVNGPGRGRPRRRPVKLPADKGDDHRRVRRSLAGGGLPARIARRGVESSARLGRHRGVVERSRAWLLSYRRLALRDDRSEATITALLAIACALICHRRLVPRQGVGRILAI